MESNYSDNVLVESYPDGAEYLQISLNLEPIDFGGWSSELSLTRYCVPGRVDRYSFDYAYCKMSGIGSRFRYFTDYNLSLVDAITLVQLDLDKPAVVEMITEFFKGKHKRYINEFRLRFLNNIAPNCELNKILC